MFHRDRKLSRFPVDKPPILPKKIAHMMHIHVHIHIIYRVHAKLVTCEHLPMFQDGETKQKHI